MDQTLEDGGGREMMDKGVHDLKAGHLRSLVALSAMTVLILSARAECSRRFTPVVVDSFSIMPPINAPGGICSDGNSLWIPSMAADGGGALQLIYNIDTRTHKIIKSIPAPDLWSSGIVWSGSNLWVQDAYPYYQTSIIKLDSTGKIVKYFKVPNSCLPDGLAWDGRYLYYGAHGCAFTGIDGSVVVETNAIFKIDPETGEIVDSIRVPVGQVYGLVYNQGRLWYCDLNLHYIFEIDTTGNVLFEMRSAGPAPIGLAFAKGYMWEIDIALERVYEIDVGLAPAIPKGLIFNSLPNSIKLSWNPSATPDIKEYKIYRNKADSLTTAALIDSVDGASTSYIDTTISAGYKYYYYWVSAVNGGGVESYPSAGIKALSEPGHSSLLQNFPNPFNPTTTIVYGVSSDSHVTLEVYDALGRVVMTLVDAEETPGCLTATLNGSSLASGVYFYRLIMPGVDVVRKMLLVK